MAQVTEIRKQRGTGREAAARLGELRARLGMELEQLTDQQSAHLLNRPAWKRRSGEGTGERDRATELRIRLLGQLIAGLPTVDPTTIHADRAGFGSTLLLRNLDSGGEAVYTLMAGEVIDVDAAQVSLASPMGQALVGCRPGDEAVVFTPQGRRRYRLLALETLPGMLGMTKPTGPDAA